MSKVIIMIFNKLVIKHIFTLKYVIVALHIYNQLIYDLLIPKLHLRETYKFINSK